ncbi:MAG: hypothetical protein ABGY95_07970 [Rubritalea sp.]
MKLVLNYFVVLCFSAAVIAQEITQHRWILLPISTNIAGFGGENEITGSY